MTDILVYLFFCDRKAVPVQWSNDVNKFLVIWSWHSHGSLLPRKLELKINRSMKTPWQECRGVACSCSSAGIIIRAVSTLTHHDMNKINRYLTIIPRARMGSELIAHEAERAIDSETMRAWEIIVFVKSSWILLHIYVSFIGMVLICII